SWATPPALLLQRICKALARRRLGSAISLQAARGYGLASAPNLQARGGCRMAFASNAEGPPLQAASGHSSAGGSFRSATSALGLVRRSGNQNFHETSPLWIASEGEDHHGAEPHAERHHHGRHGVETAKSGERGHRSWSFWKHRFRRIVGICFAGSRAINPC